MFKELTGKAAINKLEEEVLEFWHDQQIFEKSLELRKDSPLYIFFEGPPTANGRPGIHHVLGRTIKDIICRFKTMQGYQVPRKAGWDTHGLPVEIAVEKKLGLTQKNEIEKIGIEKFNRTCRELVNDHIEMDGGWRKLTDRMGYWLDLDNAYVTYKNEYIESVWWAIKTIFDKGLIYKGYKIVPQSPTIETPLSSHELSLGYKEVRDPNCYIKVKVLSSPKKSIEDAELLIWTTTPWTLVSNVAAAVGEDITYVKVRNTRTVKQGDKKTTLENLLVLAESRLPALDGEYEILESFKGSKIVGTVYEQIFNFLTIDRQQHPNALTLLAGDFVTTDDGSGIVHMSPAFGQDDFEMSKKFNLPVLQPITPGGIFTEAAGPFAGRPVKTFTYADGHTEEGVDKEVVIALKKLDKIYRSTNDYVHTYPHCWRTDNPVIYYARESWFINSPAYKERMVEINNTINWQPPEIGSGRFGNWLEDVKEWSLSRDRYWGTPLPLWVSEDQKDILAIGSIAELREGLYERPDGTVIPMSEVDEDEIDLHRPFVDRVIFKKDGKTYRRTPEIADVWFDSGAMPFAQLHYPFENKELFEKSFPADFICEAVDQTRGWFYTLHNIATAIFDKPAFKNIVVNDMILDKEGRKMSKRWGNVVHPFDIMDKYGADPMRWYFITVNNPWIPKRFDTRGIEEVYKKFFDTLLNSYAFFALYANIDNFDPASEAPPVADRPEIDRWVISRLYTIVEQVTGHMENYDLTPAARPIAEFLLDDVSNWYVRLNRRRFWKSEDTADKQAAYHTLYEVLLTLVRLTAPFVPFVAEALYQNLRQKDMPLSVHHDSFPKLDDAMQHLRDDRLESKMDTTQQVVRMGRALRDETRLKVRQPLQELFVYSSSSVKREDALEMASLIADELNVKVVRATDDVNSLATREAKANFKMLGPRFGKSMKQVATAIQSWDDKTLDLLEKTGEVTVDIDGEQHTLQINEIILVDQPRGNLAVTRKNDLLIALNTEITPELHQEGIAREFVNRIQNLRKESDLDVTDRITIRYSAPELIQTAIENMADYIANETLATRIEKSSEQIAAGTVDNNTSKQKSMAEVTIDSQVLQVFIEKISS